MALAVVGRAAGNPAFDGALAAIRLSRGALDAQSAALRLAPYVEALVASGAGAAAARGRLREAIAGQGATDVRTALLAWMLEQDQAFGGSAVAALLPGSPWVTRQALRRAAPGLHALAGHDTPAPAHRVIRALSRTPSSLPDQPS